MKTSIVNRLRLFLLIPLVAILGLSAILWTFNLRELNHYNNDMSDLLEKRNQLRLLQHAFEGEVSELRGFVAIQNEQFLIRMEERKNESLKRIKTYSNLPLTTEERTFIQAIERDVRTYNDKHVPNSIAFTKSANYQAITRLANDEGVTKFINSIREQLEIQMEKHTVQVNEAQVEHRKYITYSLGGFLTLLLMIPFIF